MNKFLHTVAFLLIFMGTSRAQLPDIKFDHIGVKEGLPENQVKALKQDSYGYLWMGTQNGVVRYDGYNYKVYQLGSARLNKLGITSINSIFEDAEKRLWISTFQNGIFMYDRYADTFRQYPFPGKDVQFLNFFGEDHHQNLWCRTQSNNINTIISFEPTTGKWELFGIDIKGANHIDAKLCYPPCITANGTVWLPTGNGLYKYNGAGKGLTGFFTTADTANTIGFSPVYEAPSQPGILWMNAFHGNNERLKIARLTCSDNTIKYYLPGKAPGATASANIYTIFEDKKQRLWFCSDSGLSKLDRPTDRFTNYRKSDTGKNTFSNLLETQKGNFWLTSTQGLTYFNTSSGRFQLYTGAYAPPQINDKILDNTGQLWVGSSAGAFKTNYLRSAFRVFKSIPGKTDSYPGNLHIIEEADSSGYYAASGGSIYKWTPVSGQFKLLIKTTHTDFNDVCPGDNNRIYVATDSGLKVFNLITKKEIPLGSVLDDAKAVEKVSIRSFCLDSSGLIWMTPFGHGVYSFNPATKKITQYPFKKGNNLGNDDNDGRLDDAVVITMYVDRQNTLWVGTNNGGLNRFDRATGKFYSYHTKKNQDMFCVTSMYQDNTGRLWVGTYLNGLFEFDPKSGNIIRNLNERSGLLHNEVFSISGDAAGHLILINQRGITRYAPATGQILNFKIGTLFPGNDMGADGIAVQRAHNGAIAFALNDGLVQFDPAALAPNPTPPIVHIENISVSDPLRNDPAKNIIPFGLKTLELPYNNNRIKFDYIALHFDDPSQNKYVYRLDGYDKYWSYVGTLRNATYTNLSPGTYTFHVKAANSDGVWNDAGDSIVIIINTPLWARWWAWLIYLILFAVAIYGFVSYRSRALKRENQVLEEKINERTHQLSDANKELSEQREEIITQRDQLAETVTELKTTQSQLVQREKMASLGELTAGIAHEIQNPLNFVNNFSDVNAELIDEMQLEIAKGDLEEIKAIALDIRENEKKINLHGKRADAIVKGMLQHSQSGSGAKQLTNINALADEYLRLSYHGVRSKDKSFNAEMVTHFDEKLPQINLMPQDIGRVLLNLFNNAFYAVNQKSKTAGAGYKPEVSVSTSTENEQIVIKVKDNGIGIPDAIKEKIMQPFFTTKPTGEGTGLGLSLSYDMVVKGHGGSISVNSVEGEGTEFIIALPIV